MGNNKCFRGDKYLYIMRLPNGILIWNVSLEQRRLEMFRKAHTDKAVLWWVKSEIRKVFLISLKHASIIQTIKMSRSTLKYQANDALFETKLNRDFSFQISTKIYIRDKRHFKTTKIICSFSFSESTLLKPLNHWLTRCASSAHSSWQLIRPSQAWICGAAWLDLSGHLSTFLGSITQDNFHEIEYFR